MTSTAATTHPLVASGYAELTREIRRLGLLRPRPVLYAFLVSANLLFLACLLTLAFVLRDSWWLVLLAPALAVISTQIAFMGHDVAHRQVARGRRWSTLLGLVHANLLTGLSYGWWLDKHNAHHAHPNDLEADPDVAAGVFVFDHGQAGARSGFAAWLTRHQAGLFFPMLLLESLNLHVASVRALARPGIRLRAVEIALLAVHLALYVTLLVTTMTWLQALAFVAVHQGLFGLYLGCAFAPSHKGMPSLSPEQASDPLLRQVLTSRNIRSGPFIDVVLGGLNLQIEHHLFPSMPRPNLRRAQPVVKRFCEARGVSYAEETAFGSYAEGLRHMHRVGADLRAGGSRL